MKDIIYKTIDESSEYTFRFNLKYKLRITHLGKGYPLHTQCLLFCNGLLQCFEMVVKNENDENDPLYACKLAAFKCINNIDCDFYQKEQLRNIVNKTLYDNC